MFNWLLEPLQYAFFLRGLTTGLIVAAACGVLSGFIVWRGMAFVGDALAHAVLPGIVISYFLGWNILIGALIAAVISVLAIGTLSTHKGFKEDTSIGVIFTGAFALGILLISRIATSKDLTHILFGSILGVTRFDLIITAVIGALVIALVLLFYKELLVTSFDKAHAVAIGLSPVLIHHGLLLTIAFTTVISTQTVGVVLVLALLVTPAATASLLAKKLSVITGLSVVFSLTSVLAGLYISYYFDLEAGAAVVIILTLFFTLAFAYSKIRSITRLKEKAV